LCCRFSASRNNSVIGPTDMPLIRSSVATLNLVVIQPRGSLLERLGSDDADERRRAARELSSDPAAATALAGRLAIESERAVRDALFGSLVEIGGARVADLIGRLLRSEDAALRGAAVEALKRLGGAAVPTLDMLLDDTDPVVRLLAVEVTRAWPGALAVPRLRRVLENDPHLNVCGAAIDVATEVGTADLLGPLARLRVRFADDMFLGFAIDVACTRIDAVHKREP
jgi:HEAT repeat protein